mgnify:CR=1 FL=1
MCVLTVCLRTVGNVPVDLVSGYWCSGTARYCVYPTVPLPGEQSLCSLELKHFLWISLDSRVYAYTLLSKARGLRMTFIYIQTL